MKLSPLFLAIAMAAAGVPTWAAQQDPHQGHHPAPPQPAPAMPVTPANASSPTSPDRASADMDRMDAQMKAMREMHARMMAAKTPEARKALMGEHMKAMRDGMTMMRGMSGKGMGEMKCDMAANHQMMEKRMEMMGAMMEMMMDHMPATPEK